MAKSIRKGDEMVVICGDSRDLSFEKRCGKVKSVDRKKNRVTIEGINIRKRSIKRSSQNPQGGYIEEERPIHISNVMSKEKFEQKRNKPKKD